MVVAPGRAHLHIIEIHYTLTVFWLRDKLYRDTAPVHTTNFVTGDKFMAPIKLVPPTFGTGHGATRVMLIKICTRTAKSAPPIFGAGHGIPSLTDCAGRQACTPAAHYVRAGRGVTAFWLKYQDPARMLRRVTNHRDRLAPSLKLPARQFFNARPSILPGR